MARLSIFIFSVFLVSCNTNTTKQETADQVITKAIEIACNDLCDNAKITFDFRDKQYISTRKDGMFHLERKWIDTSNTVTHDVLTNTSFTRTINNEKIVLADSMASRYSNSVNSVHYFSQLPNGLNEKAVHKKLLGEDTIKGELYYEIEVTFSEEGGGDDFDDVFVYWVHKTNYTVDYLAYQYATNGGGIRFREAYNPRIVNGVRFVDYKNYAPKDLNVLLQDLDKEFQSGTLKLLSVIENKNIEVTKL